MWEDVKQTLASGDLPYAKPKYAKQYRESPMYCVDTSPVNKKTYGLQEGLEQKVGHLVGKKDSGREMCGKFTQEHGGQKPEGWVEITNHGGRTQIRMNRILNYDLIREPTKA